MPKKGPAKPKHRIRPTQTVRERADKTSKKADKPRRVRRVASRASQPVRAGGRAASRALRPFRFVLWPFKTRPMRLVGRVLASIFLFKFFRGAWQELKGVKWPNRKETTQLTIAVFVFAIVFGVVIALADYGLDKVFKKVLIK